MKLYIASDHGGFALKEELKEFLTKKKVLWTDIGAHTLDKTDDYPSFAAEMAKHVALEKNAKGILICGSGTGMCIAANRFKKVRAALAYDLYSAKMSRRDNDVNVLCLRGRKVDFSYSKRIVATWLNTPFGKAARHKRRIKRLG